MQLNTGPITRQAYELCVEVEKLPASDRATTLSLCAAALGEKVEELERRKNDELSAEQLRKEIMSMIMRYGAESDLSMYQTIGTLEICKHDVMREINRRASIGT